MNSKKLLQEVIVDEIIKNRLEKINESVKKYSDDQRVRFVVRQNLKKKSLTENIVNDTMYKLIKEDIDKIPYNNTAMNVLKDLLKKVIPILESSYKMLTSDREQRRSFEAHIIVGIKNSIGMAKLSKDAEDRVSDNISGQDIKQYIGGNDVSPEVEDALNAYDEAVPQVPEVPEIPSGTETIKELTNFLQNSLKDIYKKTLLEKRILQKEENSSIDFNKFAPKEEKNVNTDDIETSQENPAFLDIGEKEKPVEAKEPDKIGGLQPDKYNETGRNLALDAFSKIEKSIVAAYNMLADVEDRKIFYIYLIANVVMHFKRFEDELNSALKSSDVVPTQSQDKVNKAMEQPTGEIEKALGSSKPPTKNISTPNIK